MEKKLSLKKQIAVLRVCIICFLLAFLSLFLFSFTVQRMADDFMKMLGITQSTTDDKISGTMLDGSFDTYGIKKAKTIPPAMRSVVAKEALTYAKRYVSGVAYIKKYTDLRNSKKPVFEPVKTPDQMMQENIASLRKSVLETEGQLKKADATMKPIFEKVVADGKRQLADAENPNNKQYVNYRKNYDNMVKFNQQGYDRLLAEWEQEYPADHMLFIKKRLEQFMMETNGIDFSATTVLKNGKQIFTDVQYERKGNRWKMAYRAGKDVVETSRSFIQQWLDEINQSK
jgi:hypothetical protein